jgi:hypothetical protein
VVEGAAVEAVAAEEAIETTPATSEMQIPTATGTDAHLRRTTSATRAAEKAILQTNALRRTPMA